MRGRNIQEMEENSQCSSINAAKKDKFLKQWLIYRTDPQAASKEFPADAFLRLRKEEVKDVIVSTAKQCIAEHLQAMHQSQIINLLSESESHHRTQNMMIEEESSYSQQNVQCERISIRRSSAKDCSIEGEEESESLVKGSPFRMTSAHQKNRESQVYVQEVGVQVRIGQGQGDILQIVDIREEEEGEVIYVLQYNHIATYPRNFLEKYHILSLIEYYQKLMHIKTVQNDPPNPSTLNQISNNRNNVSPSNRTSKNSFTPF